jgi:hypothetical protein
VWNEQRANLSVQVTYEGSVTLPKNKHGIPKDFPTKIVRTYTLVKDGIIHTYVLPVSLTEPMFHRLQQNGVIEAKEKYAPGKIYEADFSHLPVINRSMTQVKPSAKELCTKTYELTKVQGYTAVMNYYKKLHQAAKDKGYAEVYGVDGAEWLKELGLMPYGYSPKKLAVSTGEEANVSALEVKILKASLPSGKAEIEKVIAKIEKGVELNLREKWFEQAILDYKATVKSAKKPEDILDWIFKQFTKMNAKRRRLMCEIAQVKFLIIVGKLWFSEFKSRAEKLVTLKLDGTDYNFEIDDSEKTIKL